MPRKVDRDNIKLLLQTGILINPAGVVTAGTMNKNQALPMNPEITGIYPAGNFYVINSNFFYHSFIMSITKAPFYAMEEYAREADLC
jgi:hypothetical protein